MNDSLSAPSYISAQPADGGVVRYPDPAIETLDPRFNLYRIGSAAVEQLATGCRWAEGPVWFGDGRFLVWSDIPNNRHAALGRTDRRSERVSSAVQQQQRKHPRPAGTPDYL